MPFDTSTPRRLPFPLRQATSQQSVVGGESPEHPTLEWSSNDPDQRVTVELDLSLNEYVAIATALDVGRDIAYDDKSEYIWWLWTRAFLRTYSGAVMTGEVESAIQEFSSFMSEVYEEECEVNMALQIQRIDGIDYLVENCCGGATRFYQLTGVSIGEGGSPTPIGGGGSFGGGFTEGGGASGSWEVDGVASGNVSCYADLAVPYLLNRAYQYAQAVTQWALIAWDALTPIDEFIDVWELGSDIIQGDQDLNEIQVQSPSLVQSALTSAAVVDPLKAAWTFTGVPTNSEILRWQRNAPFFVNGVPVRLILGEWATYSTMLGYRNDLASFAAQCESGNSLPSDPSLDYDWRYTWEFFNDSSGKSDGTGGWQGWVSGSADHIWTAGQGWGRGTGSHTHYVAIENPSLAGIKIVSARWHLSAALNGDNNLISLSDGDSTIHNSGDTLEGVQIHQAEFAEETVNTKLFTGVNEWNLPESTDVKIIRVDLWGNDTEPSVGVPF